MSIDHMGVVFKKEGNACERCHKLDTDVGKMAHYKNHELDELLCQDCIKEIDDYYSLKCSKCGKPAHLRGNLIEYENEKICTICMDEINMKKIIKEEQKQERKNFMKSNWAKWITFGLTVTGIIVALLAIGI